MVMDSLRRAGGGLLVAAGLATALSPAALAGDFAVYPLRVEFAPGDRSAAVGVNNTGDKPIRFQLTLVAWTQDAEGKDVYRESDDLIYFPRLFTVPAGEQGVVRVGPKRASAGVERSYRLFVDELPDESEKPAASGITFSIRFAIPIFIGAAGARPQLAMEPLVLTKGALQARVRNTGGAHFRIESMELKSDQGYTRTTDGWYLLAGASRLHALELPQPACLAARRLELRIKTSDGAISGTADVAADMCRQ